MKAGGSEDQGQSRELCPLHLKAKTKPNQNKQNLKTKEKLWNKCITEYKNPRVNKDWKKIKQKQNPFPTTKDSLVPYGQSLEGKG